MDESFNNRFLRIFTYSLIVLIIVGGALLALPGYRRCQSLKRQEAELKAQIEQKKREIAALAEKQNRFRSDPDFVEAIARQNRRVFPGELVFVFED